MRLIDKISTQLISWRIVKEEQKAITQQALHSTQR